MHDAPQTEAAARLDKENPLGVDGFEFVEFTGPDPAAMVARLELMGFTATHVNPANDVVRLKQGDIPAGPPLAQGPGRRVRDRTRPLGQRHGLPRP